jgi:16S rRNA (guanine966-N2)-methyltransferase
MIIFEPQSDRQFNLNDARSSDATHAAVTSAAVRDIDPSTDLGMPWMSTARVGADMMTPMQPSRRPARPLRELRIIAGLWRGRRWRFPAGPDIRPTPDRVRETLFNWLAPHVRGARVLDLFAGSGALGLEALSRGAAHASFVDADAKAVMALRERCTEWSAASREAGTPVGSAEFHRADALASLATPPGRTAPFDIVFLDPPFGAALWGKAASRLESGGWLAPEAFVYIEAPAGAPPPGLPASWQAWRDGKAGEVGYHLLRRDARLSSEQESAT